MNTRSIFLAFLFVIISVVLVIRLYYLQIKNGEVYYELSQKNHLRTIVLNAPRGSIYDRNGILLSKDVEAYDLYVFPYLVKKRLPYIQEKLKEYLGIELSDDIREKIKKGYARKVVIKKNLSMEQVDKYYTYSYLLEGVFIEKQPHRIYTEYGRYMPHVLGYVGYPSDRDLEKNPDLKPDMLIGKSGVEKIFDEYLRGESGSKGFVVDARVVS